MLRYHFLTNSFTLAYHYYNHLHYNNHHNYKHISASKSCCCVWGLYQIRLFGLHSNTVQSVLSLFF